jgi:hypothetical protein
MEIIIPSAIVGFIVSVVNEFLKLSIFKNLSYGYQKLIAFILVVLGVGGYVLAYGIQASFDNLLGLFIATLVTSYAIWKTIFKPIEFVVSNIKDSIIAKRIMKREMKEKEQESIDKEAI